MAIQLVASDCSMKFPGPSGVDRSKHTDVVEPEKTALENIFAFDVLAIHPPGEIDQQLVKHAHEKLAVLLTLDASGNFVNTPGSPGMHGRIHVGEVPFIGGKFAVRMHIPFAQEKNQLISWRNRDR